MAGPHQKAPPNGLRTPPSKLPRLAIELPVSPSFAPLQREVFLPLNSVNAGFMLSPSLLWPAGPPRRRSNLYREPFAGHDWAALPGSAMAPSMPVAGGIWRGWTADALKGSNNLCIYIQVSTLICVTHSNGLKIVESQ